MQRGEFQLFMIVIEIKLQNNVPFFIRFGKGLFFATKIRSESQCLQKKKRNTISSKLLWVHFDLHEIALGTEIQPNSFIFN